MEGLVSKNPNTKYKNPTFRIYCLKINFLKSRSNSKVKRSKTLVRKKYKKYESPVTHPSRIMINVKVWTE